jgi:hypothetical protein
MEYMPLKIYFDTNVYRHITQCGESEHIRSLASTSGAEIIASNSNVMETFAISDYSLRTAEIKTLTNTATTFTNYPQSWYQALEVKQSIQRHRRQWLRPVAYDRTAKKLLQKQREIWTNICHGILPDAYSLGAFRRDFETGAAYLVGTQKGLRQNRLRNEMKYMLKAVGIDIDLMTELDLSKPEVFWRADCLMVWFNAIVARNPSSRDYYDWLGPYIKADAFLDNNYASFWLMDIHADDAPKNRVASLTSLYQLDKKISHGNPEDSQHACYAVDVDIFFTADIAFYETLCQVAGHFTKFASLRLVDRSAQSVLSVVRSAIEIQ